MRKVTVSPSYIVLAALTFLYSAGYAKWFDTSATVLAVVGFVFVGFVLLEAIGVVKAFSFGGDHTTAN